MVSRHATDQDGGRLRDLQSEARVPSHQKVITDRITRPAFRSS
jgi:hypothetical protein